MNVIIIDDDEVNNFLCKKVMELSTFSTDVHSCESAQEGLEYLIETKGGNPEQYPDILFLDINMPINTGWDFLDMFDKALETKSVNPLKIYMLSSSVYEEDINKAEAHVLVTQYVTKPLDESILKKLK